MVRILVALAILGEMFFQYIPNMDVLFGPHGVAYQGLHEEYALRIWRWFALVFWTDNLTVIWIAFFLWMAATIGLLFGWRTPCMAAAVWFLTACFISRNPIIKNHGDDVLSVTLFLLLLTRSGTALSLDHRRERRRWETGRSSRPIDADRPVIPAWGVRLMQIQLCLIYLTTGIAKLRGGEEVFDGTWWQGTSIYYVFHDVTLARISPAEFALPFWMSFVLSYVSVWWETLFVVLVLFQRTRKWALWFGVLFHLGIWLTIEVGWFSFYTLSLYGAWIPGEFWDRWRRPMHSSTPS